MWLSFVLVSACLLAAATSADRIKRQSEPQADCVDDANKPGTCGPISECPALHWMIENGRQPSKQEITFLRGKTCGAKNKQVLLCCTSPSPDFHPNKRLLFEGKLCGTNVYQKIRSGTEVPLGKYPWMALLFYKDSITGKEESACGGALIGLQHVLTAAHCVTGLGRPSLRLSSVRLGEHDLRNETDCQRLKDGTDLCNAPQDFGIEETFVHEDYNIPVIRDNDIALLKLERPVEEDHLISKICLPFGIAQHRDYEGVNLTVAGFGRIGPNRSSPSSHVLLEATLPGINQQVCRRIIRRSGGTLSQKQICAGGERGLDSCGGDSGGPVIAASPTGPPYTLIGIVSFGSRRCGEGGIPSVNTRVSDYLNWILDRVDD